MLELNQWTGARRWLLSTLSKEWRPDSNLAQGGSAEEAGMQPRDVTAQNETGIQEITSG